MPTPDRNPTALSDALLKLARSTRHARAQYLYELAEIAVREAAAVERGDTEHAAEWQHARGTRIYLLEKVEAAHVA